MPEIPVKIRSNDNEREYQNFIIKVNSKELNATNQKRRGGVDYRVKNPTSCGSTHAHADTNRQ